MWHGEETQRSSTATTAHSRLQPTVWSLPSADPARGTHQNFETWHARMLFEDRTPFRGCVMRSSGSSAAKTEAVQAVASAIRGHRCARPNRHPRWRHTASVRRVTRSWRQVIWQRGTPAVRRHAAWLLSLIAMAEGDCAAARHWIHAPFEHDGRRTLPRYPLEVTDEIQLARIGRAAEDDQLASLALTNARKRHDLNPNIPSIAATYAHVRGLLGGSVADPRG